MTGPCLRSICSEALVAVTRMMATGGSHFRACNETAVPSPDERHVASHRVKSTPTGYAPPQSATRYICERGQRSYGETNANGARMSRERTGCRLRSARRRNGASRARVVARQREPGSRRVKAQVEGPRCRRCRSARAGSRATPSSSSLVISYGYSSCERSLHDRLKRAMTTAGTGAPV